MYHIYIYVSYQKNSLLLDTYYTLDELFCLCIFCCVISLQVLGTLLQSSKTIAIGSSDLLSFLAWARRGGNSPPLGRGVTDVTSHRCYPSAVGLPLSYSPVGGQV